MPGYTRKQAVTCISILYLIGVSALAGYATSRSDRMKIPISSTLSTFTTFLPIVSGILLEAGYDITRLREKRKRIPRGQTPRPPLLIIANTLIFIYSTVVITLLGTHAAPPSGLNCDLEQRWLALFRHKNVEAIRIIQDTLRCCGLMNPHDRAWPFPDKTHKADACEKQLGYSKGCFGPWRAEEQKVAGLMITVVGLVFLWQIAIIIVPTVQASWFHRILPARVSRMLDNGEQGNGSSRRAIGYLPVHQRYTDRAIAEESEGEDEEQPPIQRSIEGTPRNVKDNNLITAEERQETDPRTRIENVWTE